METDPIHVSVANKHDDESLRVVKTTEASEEYFSNPAELINASEVLRTNIEEIHNATGELIGITVENPLDVVMHEQGIALGLTEEEISSICALGEFAEKDFALREKAEKLHKTFLERLAQSARIGVAAFAIGSSSLSTADTVTPDSGLKIHMPQTLEEKKSPRTHEEVMRQLRGSILAPVENVGFFERKNNDESFVPIILKEGASNTVSINSEEIEKIKKAMESNTSDIKIVHTHPINKGTSVVGGLSDCDKEIFHRGGIPRVAMNPSTTDFEGLAAHLSNYPPAQLSGRVIDPSGEWEYGIADSAAPFIDSMRKISNEISEMKMPEFTPEEHAYMKKLNLENIHPQLQLSEVYSHVRSDSLARSVFEKMSAMALRVAEIKEKNISQADSIKFRELDGGWSPWMNPGTPEGDTEIARREKIAAELGFRMKYSPNSLLPKTEHCDDSIALRVEEVIDDARLDALGSEYPYIDKYGNKLSPPLPHDASIKEERSE